MKNCMTACFGCSKTAPDKSKIKYKEYQLENRKKAFGVEYINLVQEGAEEEKLKECLDAAKADLDKIKKEISDLLKKIEDVDRVTKSKIVQKPTATTKPEEAKEDAVTAAPAPTSKVEETPKPEGVAEGTTAPPPKVAEEETPKPEGVAEGTTQ
jgi:hypothetical protein